MIEVNDPIWPRLQSLARGAKSDPTRLLSMEDVYGDVVKSKVFRSAFSDALNSAWSKETAETPKAYVGQQ